MNELKRAVLLVIALAAVGVPISRAHCDTLQGPVVVDARRALADGKVDAVLKWVKPDAEPAVRAAFARAAAVRGQSSAVAELADTYFFETLVRLHRAGEGEPYTGLKSEAAEPGIAAADRAVASGELTALRRELDERLQPALEQRFAKVRAAQKHAGHSVEAGREYVAAYVAFMHLSEQLFALADAAASHGSTHEHSH